MKVKGRQKRKMTVGGMTVEDMLSVITVQNSLIMRAIVESGNISKASYRAIAKEWNEVLDKIKEKM